MSSESAGTRVLIIDDHQLFADVIKSSLEAGGMDVVGIAQTPEEGLEAAERAQPELALIDFGLPGMNGIEVGRRLRGVVPDVTMIAVTGMKDSRLVDMALDAGFHGYLTKDTPLSEFVSSVEEILGGDVVTTSKGMHREPKPSTGEERSADLLAKQLTPREKEVLALLVEGASSDDIADRLDISSNTVRTHVQSILTKLQVSSRLSAATFAVKHKILETEETGPS
ncbi:MAG: response regulator transcription factor [Actinomycetota bacterium]|nr:response regulator transcription factor [Actinomycetota bacterium]